MREGALWLGVAVAVGGFGLSRPDVEHRWLTAAVAAPAPCEGPEADPVVAAFHERVEAYDGLYRLAVDRLGAPRGCEGEITMEFDGASFGTLVFSFAGGATYAVETMPPETSVAALTVPGGFADPEAMRAALSAHTERIGLRIDWSSPEITRDGDRIVHAFRDADPGLNAAAALVYAGERLVGVRVSMAL